MNEAWTYWGLVDDFAIRHRDGHPIHTMKDLNEQLVHAVMVGGPLLINDGYVLMNNAIQQAIVRPDASPFRGLVECGFIQILSRNRGRLERVAEKMANDNIRSAELMLSSDEYRNSYHPALAAWSTELNSGNYTWSRPWPELKTHQFYAQLGSLVLDQMTQVKGSEGDQACHFRDVLGDKVGSRTAWEEKSTELKDRQVITPQTHHRLMAAANEAYQYSWGCLLTGENDPICVATRATRYLGDLDQPIGEATETRTSPVKVFGPDPKVVRKGVGNRWDVLVKCAAQGSEARAAKRAYLKVLETYHTRDDVGDDEINDAARTYSAVLAKMFGHQARVGNLVDYTFAAASIPAALLVTGPPGVALGICITVAGLAVKVKPVQYLVSRLGQTKPKRWISEVAPSDPRSATSLFQLDPVKVRVIRRKVDAYEEGIS